MQAYGAMQKNSIHSQYQYSVFGGNGSSFMLLLLYLKENSNLEPEMVVAPHRQCGHGTENFDQVPLIKSHLFILWPVSYLTELSQLTRHKLN